jgi:hypothetical protein
MRQDKKLDYIIGELHNEILRVVNAPDFEKVGCCTTSDIKKLGAKKSEEIT